MDMHTVWTHLVNPRNGFLLGSDNKNGMSSLLLNADMHFLQRGIL